MIPNWTYQTEKVALIPYDRAWPIFPDGLLGHLYLRTKQDGLLDTVFCGCDPIDFDWVVGYLGSRKVTMQIYCLQEEGKPPTPVGYCYVMGIGGRDGARKATFGFTFFKEYWGRPELRDLVTLGLAYWMKELKIDVLHGITLRDNFLARNFARKFGFSEVATIPKFLYRQGELTDARVVMLSREEFEPRWQEWRVEHRV